MHFDNYLWQGYHMPVWLDMRDRTHVTSTKYINCHPDFRVLKYCFVMHKTTYNLISKMCLHTIFKMKNFISDMLCVNHIITLCRIIMPVPLGHFSIHLRCSFVKINFNQIKGHCLKSISPLLFLMCVSPDMWNNWYPVKKPR